MAQQARRTSKRHDTQALAAVPSRTRTIARAVALALFAGGALPAIAMPTGGEVAAGSATIGAVSNNRMQIDQGSQKAVLNWQGFSIAGNESVHFQQPAGGMALNRVLGTDPSSIFGMLSATGKLFLVNPNGVFFAPGASVDVGGLVASTLNMSNEDFMSGNFRFINGGAAKNILNQGTLRAADGGYIALLAPEVRNEGVVSARLGTVAFGSGEKVRLDMNGDGLLGMVVEKSAVQGLIENRHMAEVSGGQVIMSARAAGEVASSVINNSGVIKATGLVERGGVIRLEAAQVNQHGLADAGGAGSVSVAADNIMSSGTTRAAGGDVDMQAQAIYLDGSVDAGNAGGAGGSVSLSGHTVDIASSGTVSADGTSGGSISLASDAGGRVMVSGALSAQGSAGDGGRIKATAWNLSLLGGSADADGAQQGGKIWWGGAGPDERGAMAQADHTLVSGGASMSAKGTGQGASGGEIIAYGKESMAFLGSAQAQGAAANGGFIELSSQGEWRLAEQSQGQINAGAGGEVLIDPKNITINSGGTESAQGYAQLALRLNSATPGAPFGTATPPQNGDHFGYAVSLDADRMAVGQTEVAGTQQGSVYIFDGLGTGDTFGTPRLTLKLGSGSSIRNADGSAATLSLANGDVFGTGVAIQGERLAVGAQWANGGVGSQQGAAYLFDGIGSSGPVATAPRMALKLEHGTVIGGYTMNLASGDNFGNALALDGDRLAIGAYLDDTGGPDRGAVYIYDGFGSSGAFNTAGLRMASKLASGSAVGTGTLALTDGENFGSAVALSGNRMAVGSWRYNGETGAVHMFDNLGGAGAYQQYVTRLTNGSALGTGGSATTLNLVAGDQFGSSAALDGNHLAVGAYGDGGFHQGAIYLFDDVGASGSVSATPRMVATLRNGSAIAAADGSATTLSVGNGDLFGAAVALQGNRMAVGAYSDDTAGANRGSVLLFNMANTWTGGRAYASAAGADQTISSGSLATLLATGQNVTLQANNDITLDSYLGYGNSSGNGGALTLQAGRSILVNGSIDSDHGNVTLLANQPASTGVVNAQRDAGEAVITMAAGTYINAGTGTATLRVGTGAGNTNNASGDITLGSITAGIIDVVNQGPSAGSDVVLRSGATLTSPSAVPGTTITLATAGAGGGRFENQGSDNIDPGAGRYLVYSNNPDATVENMSGYAKRYATAYGSTTGVASTGNYFLYTISPTLNVTPDNVSRVYDGTASATLTYTATGFIDGDTAATALAGGLARADAGNRNVGTYAISQNDLAAQMGYTLSYTGSANFSITARTVTASITAADKVYDGSAAASAASAGLANVVGSEDVGFSFSSASFADKNVGTGKLVTASGVTLTGADAANYVLNAAAVTDTADITARTITATVSGGNKVYDGTTAATVSGALDSAVLVAGDDLRVSAASASFADKNVGTAKIINATGLLLAGADAGNYVLSNAGSSATATADITPRTVTAGITAADKVYDGNTTAAATAAGLANVVSGDDLSYSFGPATFADKNAGTAKTVTASGVTLGGADAGNYVVASTATTTADITPRTVTASVTGNSKVYDATTIATVNGSVSGTIAGDSLGVGATSASFDNANAGTGKTVTASGLSLTGADAGNYVLASNTANTTADITPRTVTAGITAADKVYDATTIATVNGSVSGTIAGDSLGVGTTSASFDNADAGTGKTVTASGLSLTGADAGNYVLASNTANTTADITLRSLTVRANDATRPEGQPNPAFTASYTGLAGRDTPAVVNGLVLMSPAITSSPSGAYAITASGATAQNYQVSMVNGVLSIIPLPPQPAAFNTQVGSAVVSAQSLLTANSAIESAIQVAQNEEDSVSPTTGAGSSAGSGGLLEVRGTGIRMPEAAQ